MILKTTVTRQFSMSLERAVILALIQKEFPNVPDRAKLTITVPGGGDWSNTELDLRETTIDVEWTETEHYND